MKKTISSIAILTIISLIYYFNYLQSDKKLLSDFAHEVVDSSTILDTVIVKYVECNKVGSEVALFLLTKIRKEYNENDGNITIYTYEEGLSNGYGKEIKNINKTSIYFIRFNKNSAIPVMLSDKSKIVAISAIKKGDGYYLMRTDGIKF